MISERERLQLTREMIEAGSKLHKAVQPPKDRVAVNAALGAALAMADTIRADMRTVFTQLVLAIEYAMRVAAASNPLTEGTIKALEDAVQDAQNNMAGVPSTRDWRATYFGGGFRQVFFRLPDGREHYVFDVEVSLLVDRFGPCLVSALFQLAAGANRVLSLLHLLNLNTRHVVRDSVAYDRNFTFIGTTLFGYLTELSRVIDDLHEGGIVKKLSDPKPWLALKRERSRWRYVRDFRNNVAFHLGWLDRTGPQMVELANDHAREIAWEFDGSHPYDMRFTGGENLLLRSAGTELKNFREIAGFSLDAWGALLRSVQAIFIDLLHQCGARTS